MEKTRRLLVVLAALSLGISAPCPGTYASSREGADPALARPETQVPTAGCITQIGGIIIH